MFCRVCYCAEDLYGASKGTSLSGQTISPQKRERQIFNKSNYSTLNNYYLLLLFTHKKLSLLFSLLKVNQPLSSLPASIYFIMTPALISFHLNE